MNSVTVNRKTHSITYKKCKNLGQLIAALEKEGEVNEQFIVKMKLNGRLLDAEEEQLLDGLSIDEVDEIIVQYSTLGEIVGRSITDIIAAIQGTQITSIQFCKDFRKNAKLDDEKVKYVLIQCRSIIEALEEVFTTHASGKFHIKHHSLWIESEKELTNILQCILQSRKMSDVDFVADLMEYDLVDALDQWEDVLERELLDNPTLSGIFRLNNGASSGDNGVDA